MDDCYDKIRFMLCDETGDLRFTAFEIINSPEYASQVEEIRAKLLSQRLVDISTAEIPRIS